MYDVNIYSVYNQVISFHMEENHVRTFLNIRYHSMLTIINNFMIYIFGFSNR